MFTQILNVASKWKSRLTATEKHQPFSRKTRQTTFDHKRTLYDLTNIPVASSAQSREPCHRRIDFTIMMVVDAEKHNDRWKEQNKIGRI